MRPDNYRDHLVTLYALALLLGLGCASAPPRPPDPLPPSPAIERLANGVTLIIAPTATVGLYLAAAPDLEPIGLEGLSALLLEHALDGAGPDAAAPPHPRALQLGATLTTWHDGAMLGWELAFPSPPTDSAGAYLLLDLATAPHLPPSGLEAEAEWRRELLAAHADLADLAARRWAAALALGHGRPLGDTPSDLTLARVNRESLLRQHRRLVRPSALVIVAPQADPALRARLDALTEPDPAPPVTCRSPGGSRHALAAPGETRVYRARPVPPRGTPMRAYLDALFDRARLLPLANPLDLAVVDLGRESALVYRLPAGIDEVRALSHWQAAIEASLALHPPAPRDDVRALASAALFGAPAPMQLSLIALEPGVTLEVGEPAPGARVLPLDQSRCRN